MREDRTMAETQLTTWDGLARADTPPFGATVMVHARTADGLAILLLRRSQIAHEHADWAWTPPAGARLPDEPIHICAARELEEETGMWASRCSRTSERMSGGCSASRWTRAPRSPSTTNALDSSGSTRLPS